MGIKVDMTQANKRVANGLYEATIVDAEIKDSQSSEYQYILWQIRIKGGESAGEQIGHMTSLAPKAIFGLKSFLVAAGYEGIPEEGDANQEMDLDPKEMFGAEILIEVGEDSYGGEKRAKIKKVYPIEMLEELAAKAEAMERRGSARR